MNYVTRRGKIYICENGEERPLEHMIEQFELQRKYKHELMLENIRLTEEVEKRDDIISLYQKHYAELAQKYEREHQPTRVNHPWQGEVLGMR